jgi:basic membrane protein A
MRRIRSWLIPLAAGALLLAACGGSSATTTSAAAVGGEKLKIAIVAPSAKNDLAFTQSIVDAANRLENVEIAITDNTFVVEDAASAIRGYAEDGYDLVIAHGSQFGDSVKEIAADFPDTSFAWGTAADTFGMANVYAYDAKSDQGGYAMGVMAAALSKSGVIGIIGPIEVGDAKLYVDGFIAGAKAENPDVNATATYTGSFSDTALAASAADAFVSAGADVLTGSAQMTVGAIGVAADKGLAWFGTQSNQASVAPGAVVASQVYHWEVALTQIVDGINSGKLGGEIYSIDLANGGEVIEYNDGYSLADDVKAKGEAAIAGIKDGSIKTGS